MQKSLRLRWGMLTFLLLFLVCGVVRVEAQVPWDTPGYLVIGGCYTSLADASREYDQRVEQGFPYVHIRNTRNWATSLTSGYYAVVYNACATAAQAKSYADEVRRPGIDVYVKHSGRPVGEAGGKAGYYVIGLCSTDEHEAFREAAKYRDTKYIDICVWKSNEFYEFTPGYYCVIFTVCKSLEDANAYANYVKSNGIDVYVKYGTWKG